MKDKIAKIMDNGFYKNNGFDVVELTKEKCIMEYQIKESGLNPYNIVHGGIMFGLADTCAGVLSSVGGRIPVTTNANINYLKEANGSKLLAEATILKEGNKLGYYNVNIYNDQNELVAQANVNMYFISKEK